MITATSLTPAKVLKAGELYKIGTIGEQNSIWFVDFGNNKPEVDSVIRIEEFELESFLKITDDGKKTYPIQIRVTVWEYEN
jgi:hypothetical protein